MGNRRICVLHNRTNTRAVNYCYRRYNFRLDQKTYGDIIVFSQIEKAALAAFSIWFFDQVKTNYPNHL